MAALTHFLLLLTLAGMVNFSTTCCCGESVFCEMLRGGCDDHGEHAGHDGGAAPDHGRAGHHCYKGAGDIPIPGQVLDGVPDETVSTAWPRTATGPLVSVAPDQLIAARASPDDGRRSLARCCIWLL